MGRYRQTCYIPESEKDKLRAAFVCFRKLGLVARQGFMCCGGCAGAEIASRLGDKLTKLWNTRGPDAAKRQFDKIKGCVFYTRQDADSMRYDGRVWLAYGSVDSTEAGEIGLPTVEVGNMIAEVLTTLGMKFEWDGNGDRKIVIDLRDQRDVARRAAEDAAWRARIAADEG
jgi:hypothetical protein